MAGFAEIFMAKENEILRLVSNREERRALQMEIGMLPDLPHRVTIARTRPSKTMRQLGYYFSTHVEIWRQYLSAQWGYQVSVNQSHQVLKENCLRIELVNEQTGEVVIDPRTDKAVEVTGSVAELNVEQMSEYMMECAEFICDQSGMVVPEPRWTAPAASDQEIRMEQQ